jgi:hypothetical protein
MRRFSIALLMAVVLVCGVAVAALRDASDAWAGALLLLTLFLLGSSLLGILHRRDGKRAFWQGFALFGWGYLVLAQAPWFAEQVTPKLPTTQLLGYAHGKLNPSPAQSAFNFALADSVAASSTDVFVLRAPPQAGGASARPVVKTTNVQPAYELIFTSLLPGAGNLDQFQRVGHCLFTLLAALTGAAVSRWFHRTGRAEPTPAHSDARPGDTP